MNSKTPTAFACLALLSLGTAPAGARPLAAVASEIKSVDDALDAIRQRDEQLDNEMKGFRDPIAPNPIANRDGLSLLDIVALKPGTGLRPPPSNAAPPKSAPAMWGGYATFEEYQAARPPNWTQMSVYDQIVYLRTHGYKYTSFNEPPEYKTWSRWDQLLYSKWNAEAAVAEPKLNNPAVWLRMSRGAQEAYLCELMKLSREDLDWILGRGKKSK